VSERDSSRRESGFDIHGNACRRESQRWIIENGYKQIKSFRVRTTSMNHEYRFFNFLFACTSTTCGD
jgi:hypothetical protein